MIEIGRLFGDRLQRGVARSDDFRLGFAAAFERVLDEAGDVLFVFDDEYPVLWHAWTCRYRAGISQLCRKC